MGLLSAFRHWIASVAPPPFKRTVCACDQCISFCKTKPGVLVPTDIQPIAQRLVELKLIERPDEVGRMLRATRGTLVLDTDTGKQVRIPAIGPARNRRGRCDFLDETDRCRIHGVSPFGCAYFDAHMEQPEIERRQLWALAQIRGSESYQALRQTLPLAEGGKNEGT